jgi:hypothetical protein
MGNYNLIITQQYSFIVLLLIRQAINASTSLYNHCYGNIKSTSVVTCVILQCVTHSVRKYNVVLIDTEESKRNIPTRQVCATFASADSHASGVNPAHVTQMQPRSRRLAPAHLIDGISSVCRPQTCNEVVYISMYITVHTLNYEKNIKNISIYPRF